MAFRSRLLKSLFVFFNALIFVLSQSEPNCYEGEMAQKLNNRFLAEHNKYRDAHGVPPLELDPELMENAMDWSRQMVRKLKVETSSLNDVGENLYVVYSTGHVDESMLQPTDAWYRGIEKYTGSYSPESGHYTQVVWKSTQKLGCGICRGDNMTAVTCRYHPPGNIVSEQEYKENVLPSVVNSGAAVQRNLQPIEGPIQNPTQQDPILCE